MTAASHAFRSLDGVRIVELSTRIAEPHAPMIEIVFPDERIDALVASDAVRERTAEQINPQPHWSITT